MSFTSLLILSVLITCAVVGLEVAASSPAPKSVDFTHQGMDAASTDESIVVVFPATNQINSSPAVLKTAAPRPIAVLRIK